MKLSELRKIAEAPGPVSFVPSQQLSEAELTFIKAFHPALALELIGLIELAKELFNGDGGPDADDFMKALRKWESS